MILSVAQSVFGKALFCKQRDFRNLLTQGEFSFSIFLLALLLVLFSCLGNRILMVELAKVKSEFHYSVMLLV